MAKFKKWTNFNKDKYTTFQEIPNWNMSSYKKKHSKPRINPDEPVTFENVTQGEPDAIKALDKNVDISIKTPNSVRWIDDQLNEQLPYNLSNKEDDLITPEEIKSTCIDSWDYSPKTLDLDVYFVSNPGKKYTFPNVPKSVVKRWILAPSKGQFYWKVIRRYSNA